MDPLQGGEIGKKSPPDLALRQNRAGIEAYRQADQALAAGLKLRVPRTALVNFPALM